MTTLPPAHLTYSGADNILLSLQSSSLISLCQLYDDGCNILFNEKTTIIVNDNGLIMQGTRNKRGGLWDIPIKWISLQSECVYSTYT